MLRRLFQRNAGHGGHADEVAKAPQTPQPRSSGGRIAAALIRPIKVELSRPWLNPMDDEDRELATELGAVMEWMLASGSKLDPGRATRYAGDLYEAVPRWFQRRRGDRESWADELTRLMTVLGHGLRSLNENDTSFYDDLEERLHQLGSVVREGRPDRGALELLVDDLSKLVDDQVERHNEHIHELGMRLDKLGAELDTTRDEAETDGLTELANRRSFDRALESMLRRANVGFFRFALVLVDLDHFKELNDECGHLSGDRGLRTVADAFRAVVLRREDHIARYGGDEFAVLLADCDDEAAMRVAERIRVRIEGTTLETPKGDRSLTASIGVAVCDKHDDSESIIARADAGLYAAKDAGRNCAKLGRRGGD